MAQISRLIKENKRVSAISNLCLGIECSKYNDRQNKCTLYQDPKDCHLVKDGIKIDSEPNKILLKETGDFLLEIKSEGIYYNQYNYILIELLEQKNKQFFEQKKND